MDKAQALDTFWNSFGLPAYDESSVPDDAVKPYITYNVPLDSLGNQVSLYANLWYRDTSWAAITKLSEEIAKRVKGDGYEIQPFDGGYLWLMGGTPFSQRINDPDSDIKRIYINLQAEFLCKY